MATKISTSSMVDLYDGIVVSANSAAINSDPPPPLERNLHDGLTYDFLFVSFNSVRDADVSMKWRIILYFKVNLSSLVFLMILFYHKFRNK